MYTPPDKDLWTGRIDAIDGDAGMRWHQKIQPVDMRNDLPECSHEKNGILLMGFECDEGVRRNKGRHGAAQGPAALRKACANHAWHIHEKTMIFDGGNVRCDGEALEEAQQELRTMISEITKKGYFSMVFGGGHEVAWPHYAGLSDALPQSRIGIINFDAHFDLRKPENGPSSGTPFFQIAELTKAQGKPFDYFVIGIQPQSNTKALFDRAHEQDVKNIPLMDLAGESIEKNRQKLMHFIKEADHLCLTVCLDVFDQAFAPGVSAPAAAGMLPQHALVIISEIMQTGKVIGANIAELNPAYDRDGQTARLAAKLVYEILSII